MSNIIDKIQLSGITYDIGGQGGSGVSVVEVTQAEYDALPTSAKTDTSKMYVITDAEAVDLTNYYTKSETNTLLGGKQATLVSGTNIKTINNESILGSGNIDIQGGGGKAIEAGRGISITTGETADTVSFNLPISAGTGNNSIIGGYDSTANGEESFSYGVRTKAQGAVSAAFGDTSQATGNYSFATNRSRAEGVYSFSEGNNTQATNNGSHSEGYQTQSKGLGSHSEGLFTTASTDGSHTEGYETKVSNIYEHSSGKYNKTVSASTTFGDSGNTLFSVGNGTADNARHNAFEIRQNGDIYITKDGSDVKLQDQLGGGGSSYTAGDGIDITNEVISVTGKVDTSAFTAHTADTVIHVTSAEKAAWDAKSDFSGSYNDLTDKPTIPTVPTSNTAFTNDAGYITSSALDGYATTGDVQTATNDMATKTWVGNQGYLTEHQSLSNYYTKSETSGATQISTALASKVDTSTYTAYTASTDAALATKQTTLTAGTNITIVDNIISAEGGGSITIDPSLNKDSNNAVANSAITNNTLSGGVDSNDYLRTVRFWKNNGEVAWYKRYAAINGSPIFVNGTTEAPNFQLVETSSITTSVTSSSTDAQVPSAKAVYDIVGNIETLLSQI